MRCLWVDDGRRWGRSGYSWRRRGSGERSQWVVIRLDKRGLYRKVKPRIVSDTQRREIDEISRKRYGENVRQRKRYEVNY